MSEVKFYPLEEANEHIEDVDHLTRILNAIQKLDEKLDRIQEAAAKEFRL